MPKPRKRPNMVRHHRHLTRTEVPLLRRVLVRECHALGWTWEEVGRLFQIVGSMAREDAANIHPGDLV